MTRRSSKYTTEENDAWLDLIMQSLHDPSLDAAGDQKRVVDGFRGMWDALIYQMQEVESDIQKLKHIGTSLESPTELRELSEHFEAKRARLVQAIDIFYSLILSDNHPVQRFIDVSRHRMVKGRRKPDRGEAAVRCILAAFIEVASERRGVSMVDAAKHASSIIERVGLRRRSANEIRSYVGNNGFGHWDAGYKDARTFFLDTPDDAMDRAVLVLMARTTGSDAVILAFKRLIG